MVWFDFVFSLFLVGFWFCFLYGLVLVWFQFESVECCQHEGVGAIDSHS